MKSKSCQIRIQIGRVLRLEPLETRNLLASVPWAFTAHSDLHHAGPDFHSHGQGHIAEMGPALQQSGVQVRSFALGPAPRTGFRSPGPHAGDRLAGTRRDTEILVQNAPPPDLRSPVPEPLANQIIPPALGTDRPRPLAENDNAPLRPNLSLTIVDSLPQAIRLTPVEETRVSLVFAIARTVPGNAAGSAERAVDSVTSLRGSSNSAVPANVGAALPRFDARFDPPLTSLSTAGRPGTATPTYPSDDAVAFSFGNEGLNTSPLDSSDLDREETGPFSLPWQNWPPTGAATQLEQVIHELFLDSGHADSQRGLDELLDTLLQENKRTSKQDVDMPAQNQPASQPRTSSQAEVSHDSPDGLQGGMIAMGLPQDQWFSHPLRNQSLPIDVEQMRDQSRAWTASVELYRSQEWALATKSAAHGKGAGQVSEDSTGKVASRLRPLLALSSVAMGAILIGLRRYRQGAQRREQADQKLV